MQKIQSKNINISILSFWKRTYMKVERFQDILLVWWEHYSQFFVSIRVVLVLANLGNVLRTSSKLVARIYCNKKRSKRLIFRLFFPISELIYFNQCCKGGILREKKIVLSKERHLYMSSKFQGPIALNYPTNKTIRFKTP